MAELGRINAEQRIACPHCSALLDSATISQLMEGEEALCPGCLQAVRLPERVTQELKRQKYVGTNLDFTA